jgi:hypothetical protein
MSSLQEELPLPKTYRQLTFMSMYGILLAVLIFIFCIALLFIFVPSQIAMIGPVQNAWPRIILIGIGVIAVCGIPFSCIFFFKQLRCRLVLIDQGIIRYDTNMRQFIPWSNILGIGYQGRNKGLRMKEPANCSRLEEGIQRNIAALETSKTNWIARDRCADFFPIPKEISERDWENGVLGAYLQKYASIGTVETWNR